MRKLFTVFICLMVSNVIAFSSAVHNPTSSIGYTDGTHAHSYTANPNYLQDASSLNAAESNIHSDQAADIYISFLFDTGGKSVYCVYTTDGTEPTKNNGSVVSLSFSKYDDPDRFWYGTIPSIGSQGTTVKYIFYISNGSLSAGWGRVSSGSYYETSWTEGVQTSYSFTTIAPLPVELSSFTATKEANAIALNWTTLSEENNAGFEVERSTNGEDFEVIGHVEGAGNSIEKIDYNFMDENPANGINYYRLKQTDFDGAFEYSKIVSVEFESQVQAIVFPNPMIDNLTIRADTQDKVNIRIFNLFGQIVYQNTQRIDNQMDIDLSMLPAGSYFLQVISDTTQDIIFNSNFVKE